MTLDQVIALLTVRRKEMGLTQAQVALRAGIWQCSISDFERGESQPRLNTLVRWANALECVAELTLTPIDPAPAQPPTPPGGWPSTTAPPRE